MYGSRGAGSGRGAAAGLERTAGAASGDRAHAPCVGRPRRWYSRGVSVQPGTVKTGSRRRCCVAAVRALVPAVVSAAAVTAVLLATAPLAATAPLPSATKACAAGRTPAGRAWADRTPVPILMYHHVQAHLDGSTVMYVSPRQFRRQLSYLKRNGYHPVTMKRVWQAWNGGRTLPRRPVVLSFDDGYLDQYTNAARILRPYHWPAVLNLVVRRGTALTDADVRRMVSWGWEVGSHTMDHKVLTRLSSKSLRYQLTESRRVLRRKFHQPVDFFCYPYGEHNGRVERAVEDAGYLGAAEVKYGAATPYRRWAMKRIAVWWGESLTKFGERMRDAVAQAR